MTSAGTAGEPADSLAELESAEKLSRASIFVVAALDSVSFALFYLPFSSVAVVIGGILCRVLAGD
ncbi:MAG TPA: hypothetical protein VGZ91_05050 [Candidatus Sulfotelmatobacter sp.]|jgi:hypothetical protein|nr:hypothetical protein [Candidatus Sulfotelmatobacter sp.]